MGPSPLESCHEWYIYNSQTQEQLGPIDSKKTRQFLLGLDSVSQSETLVWCPYWKDWKRGTDALVDLGNFPMPTQKSPPPVNLSKFQKQGSSAPIYPVDRKFPRIDGSLNVTLLSRGRCYRTRTKTLSMGGMGFVATVPRELFAPNCKAVLSSVSASHGIVASLKDVASSAGEGPVRCVRFEELRGSALTTYIEWLKSISVEVLAA
jgi:hypothetical protein